MRFKLLKIGEDHGAEQLLAFRFDGIRLKSAHSFKLINPRRIELDLDERVQRVQGCEVGFHRWR